MIEKITRYWDQLRADRAAPCRSEIDPRKIDYAIENLFILERVSGTDIRFRLAGRKVCEALGKDARGLSAATLVCADDQERFLRLIDKVLTEPGIANLRFETPAQVGKIHREEIVLLPVCSDDGQISRVLGCCMLPYHGANHALPRRISAIAFRAINVGAQVSAAEIPPGFAEPAALFEPNAVPKLVTVSDHSDTNFAAISTGKRPELRLVK